MTCARYVSAYLIPFFTGRLSQFLNASFPIDVTELGMLIDDKDEHVQNALVPKDSGWPLIFKFDKFLHW